jgi:hypothetical protein
VAISAALDAGSHSNTPVSSAASTTTHSWEVRDATMNGDVQLVRSNTDLGTCTSASHRWSLRPR